MPRSLGHTLQETGLDLTIYKFLRVYKNVFLLRIVDKM